MNSSSSRHGLGAVYALTLLAAACSLLYELLLAQTLSALLGSTVVRYSITIGCYLGALGLGAMLCERRGDHPARRLARVELSLCLLGGLSVPCLYSLDLIQSWLHDAGTPLAGTAWPGWLFLAASHLLIVAIGVLSGFEIPLLLTLGERARAGSTHRVLAFDYLGSLAASVLFPLWLLRSLGLLAAGVAVGLSNALVLLAVLVVYREQLGRAFRVRAVVATAALVLLASSAHALEEHFLHRLYFEPADASLTTLFTPQAGDDRVQRVRSPYQRIDLVSSEAEDQWLYDLLSGKRRTDPDYPLDTWLYINRAYQLFSGTDEFYHEWFVHGAAQANGRAPERVLVIGGGDGLTVRTVLQYPSVREVVHVEIDPAMIRLAREHPALSHMNGHVHEDPRVTLVIADGFQWLRDDRSRFDGIYVDLPYAKSYDLSLLYSREFYATARRRLAPDGFLALDAPGMCADPELHKVYHSTLRAAGFPTVRPYVTRFGANAPRLQARLRELIEPMTDDPRERARALAHVTGELERFVAELPRQEFLLALPTRRAPSTTLEDLGARHTAYDAFHHRLAFTTRCGRRVRPGARWVNSVARPTLPPLAAAIP